MLAYFYEIFHALAAFLIGLSFLVVVHEYGHYLAARLCGVSVTRFSIGMGPALWKRCFGRGQTEWVIAALPIGGYVKMLDEREGKVAPERLHQAFSRKSLGQRTLIVLAGPLFNLLLAVLLFASVYLLGVSGVRPLVQEVYPNSSAAAAGLQPGMEIVAVDGWPTRISVSVYERIVARLIADDGAPVAVKVRARSGMERELQLSLEPVPLDALHRGFLGDRIGFWVGMPALPMLIRKVEPGGAADRAGLRAGDRVLQAQGRKLYQPTQLIGVIRAHSARPMELLLQRDERRFSVALTPEARIGESGASEGYIGAEILADREYFDMMRGKQAALESYPVPQALQLGLHKTAQYSVLILQVLGRIVSGQASLVNNLQGPVGIAQYAGLAAKSGMVDVLTLLALLSVSLGIFNLLPIPLLDGGHLLYYLCEMVRGKPLSEKIQSILQQVGLVLLVGLFVLVCVGDVRRLL